MADKESKANEAQPNATCKHYGLERSGSQACIFFFFLMVGPHSVNECVHYGRSVHRPQDGKREVVVKWLRTTIPKSVG